jgi:hypothetical protein
LLLTIIFAARLPPRIFATKTSPGAAGHSRSSP